MPTAIAKQDSINSKSTKFVRGTASGLFLMIMIQQCPTTSIAIEADSLDIAFDQSRRRCILEVVERE